MRRDIKYLPSTGIAFFIIDAVEPVAAKMGRPFFAPDAGVRARLAGHQGSGLPTGG